MRDAEPANPDAPTAKLANHAVLVDWGQFTHQIGLIDGLEEIPIPQRKRVHTPQSKLIELVVAIVGGRAYLQHTSHGPHPLDQEEAAAKARGQPGCVDYIGVSRTLHSPPTPCVAVSLH